MSSYLSLTPLLFLFTTSLATQHPSQRLTNPKYQSYFLGATEKKKERIFDLTDSNSSFLLKKKPEATNSSLTKEDHLQTRLYAQRYYKKFSNHRESASSRNFSFKERVHFIRFCQREVRFMVLSQETFLFLFEEVTKTLLEHQEDLEKIKQLTHDKEQKLRHWRELNRLLIDLSIQLIKKNQENRGD